MKLFDTIHHVCIVVHDLDRTRAYYESIGVGPWYDYAKGEPYIELELPNPKATMRYSCVDLANIQIQLCQPGPEDSPQRRFLESRGEGVYHLGFDVEDRGAAEAAGRAMGLGIVSRGRRADDTGFCYFDTREHAGVTLEIRSATGPAKPS
jgi:methylmalonyl-CoA/ethylmalonyl-CoA epimerase